MNLILASGSPRRKELLDKANIGYKIKIKDTEELWETSFSPISTALSLAYQKGYIVAKTEKDSLVLSADTIVVYENEIIGKPKDRIDAKKIITKLSNQSHKVITAFSLISINQNIKYIGFDISTIKFKQLSEESIESYLDTNEPYDKAGAYAIQGIGSKFVEYYKGDLDNIIGLPTKKVIPILKIFLKE